MVWVEDAACSFPLVSTSSEALIKSLLPFLLVIPKGICFCSCFSCCFQRAGLRSRREPRKMKGFSVKL